MERARRLLGMAVALLTVLSVTLVSIPASAAETDPTIELVVTDSTGAPIVGGLDVGEDVWISVKLTPPEDGVTPFYFKRGVAYVSYDPQMLQPMAADGSAAMDFGINESVTDTEGTYITTPFAAGAGDGTLWDTTGVVYANGIVGARYDVQTTGENDATGWESKGLDSANYDGVVDSYIITEPVELFTARMRVIAPGELSVAFDQTLNLDPTDATQVYGHRIQKSKAEAGSGVFWEDNGGIQVVAPGIPDNVHVPLLEFSLTDDAGKERFGDLYKGDVVRLKVALRNLEVLGTAQFSFNVDTTAFDILPLEGDTPAAGQITGGSVATYLKDALSGMALNLSAIDVDAGKVTVVRSVSSGTPIQLEDATATLMTELRLRVKEDIALTEAETYTFKADTENYVFDLGYNAQVVPTVKGVTVTVDPVDNPRTMPTISVDVSRDADIRVGETIQAVVTLTPPEDGVTPFYFKRGAVNLKYNTDVLQLMNGAAPLEDSAYGMSGVYTENQAGAVVDTPFADEAGGGALWDQLTGVAYPSGVVGVKYEVTTSGENDATGWENKGLDPANYDGTMDSYIITEPVELMRVSFRVKNQGLVEVEFDDTIKLLDEGDGIFGHLLTKTKTTPGSSVFWEDTGIHEEPAFEPSVLAPKLAFAVTDDAGSSVEDIFVGDIIRVKLTASDLAALSVAQVGFTYDTAALEILELGAGNAAADNITASNDDTYVASDTITGLSPATVANITTGEVTHLLSAVSQAPAALDGEKKLLEMRFRVKDTLTENKVLTFAAADGMIINAGYGADVSESTTITPASVTANASDKLIRVYLGADGTKSVPLSNGQYAYSIYEGAQSLQMSAVVEDKDGTKTAITGVTSGNDALVSAGALVSGADNLQSFPLTIGALSGDVMETVSLTVTDGDISRMVNISVYPKPTVAIDMPAQVAASKDFVATVSLQGLSTEVGKAYDASGAVTGNASIASGAFSLTYPQANVTYEATQGDVTVNDGMAGTLGMSLANVAVDAADVDLAAVTFAAGEEAEGLSLAIAQGGTIAFADGWDVALDAASKDFAIGGEIGYDVYLYNDTNIYVTDATTSLGAAHMRAEIKLKNADGTYMTNDVADALDNPDSYYVTIGDSETASENIIAYYSPQRQVFDMLIPTELITEAGKTAAANGKFDGTDGAWLAEPVVIEQAPSMTLRLTADSAEQTEYNRRRLMYGDVNYEGYTGAEEFYIINGADVSLASRYASRREMMNASVQQNFARSILALDINGDGSITGADASILRRYNSASYSEKETVLAQYFRIISTDHFDASA